MNKLIYVVAILDPHAKIAIVELTLSDIYGKERGSILC